MAKHKRKIDKALEARQAAAPNEKGYNKPGSRNRKKGWASSPKKD